MKISLLPLVQTEIDERVTGIPAGAAQDCCKGVGLMEKFK